MLHISSAFDITVGPAAQLAFRTEPTSHLKRAAITPGVEVEIQDAFGNLVTTATDAVTVELGANPGSMIFHAHGELPGALDLVDHVTPEVLPPLTGTPAEEVTALTYDAGSGLVLAADRTNQQLYTIDPE